LGYFRSNTEAANAAKMNVFQVRDIFKELAQTHFLHRCVGEDENMREEEMYELPRVDFSSKYVIAI